MMSGQMSRKTSWCNPNQKTNKKHTQQQTNQTNTTDAARGESWKSETPH